METVQSAIRHVGESSRMNWMPVWVLPNIVLDESIVELLDALLEQLTSLVYTSDRVLRARVVPQGPQKNPESPCSSLLGLCVAPWSHVPRNGHPTTRTASR